MHLFMSVVYFLYAAFNPSDSHFYYEKVMLDYRGPSWIDFYGTSTTFIEWVGYPFIRYFGFSYEAMMVLFSFMGFLGFIYFYIFFKEHVKFRHKVFGIELLPIIFLLPNLHFWSASFGKGSIILLGMGLFFFSLSSPKERFVPLLIGSFIIYHVRPHIMLVMIISSILAFTFSSKGLNTSLRVALILVSIISFYFIYEDVLTLVGIEQGEEFAQGLDLTHRAEELTKATSGVDITSYSLPMQVFTFLFRPLFIDAPGLLGLIVSFENVFYLGMLLIILNIKGFSFIVKGNYLVKAAFFSFIFVSIALAQISGNLGIAIRQKSQVMFLFLFFVIAFLDQQKMVRYLEFRRRAKKTSKVVNQS
ncbi:hypothetical protein [Fulvivirga sedimenti]|uniref:Uncharacterized protein n=1 Tax=Fulvivirga sedimenti TaxID=2879465 RepID=A0A9X1HKC4_9BACT|nr:hypothetical protein [Fulvivirga sedimenti]MCA6073416.1 hypothetical protein [Fulvivirga sedimenti]